MIYVIQPGKCELSLTATLFSDVKCHQEMAVVFSRILTKPCTPEPLRDSGHACE